MTFEEPSRAPRILVIDDNPSIHRDFELVLLDGLRNSELDADERRLYGQETQPNRLRPTYALEHAFSGLEGVEMVKQALARDHPYQLGFVDIRMPGIDGVETIVRIWAIDPAMQIVICTAYADYSWDDLSRRLGPTDKLLVLKKPFDNIEVTQLASTLTQKWFLARQAALKFEQMELLVAQRTQSLLALQRQESAEPAEPTNAPKEPQFSGGTEPTPAEKELPLLLVAENQPEVTLVLSQIFGSDCRVTNLKDAEQALREARETVPDLVLMETDMLGFDGIALCRRLKADELTSHIPVIMIGVRGQEEVQIKALEAGADDYLIKPFNLPLLKARVHNLLRSRRKLQENPGREVTMHARDLAGNQGDALFLRRTLETVERHLADFQFDVEALARNLAVSRRQLFRKLRAVTGCTPHSVIRTMRLNRAADLLKESQLTITEITYAVGFSDLKHFRAVFREQFGVLPGEYTRKATGKPA